jgi:hypothetical protein
MIKRPHAMLASDGGQVMDVSAVCLKLAEHWQRAAGETMNETLKHCYAGRAVQYLELAARERGHVHGIKKPS